MTNSERIIRATDLIRPSRELNILSYVEDRALKQRPRKLLRTAAAVCASLALVLMLGVGAYAADLGGARHLVSVWLHGDLTEVTIEQAGDGQYEIIYPDGSTRSAGGLSYDSDGTARGITMEELVDRLLTDVEAAQDEDGRYWLYIRDHRIDITDQIEEQGYAQEKVRDGLLADYITVVWYGEDSCGIITSHYGFATPEEVRKSAFVL